MAKFSTDTPQKGSIRYLAYSPTNEPMHRLQEKQEGLVQASANDLDICGLCNSNAIVFDSETHEAVYSKGCVVIQENAETLGAKRGIYSGRRRYQKQEQTCMPTLLAFHDVGLSTFISFKCGRKRWCDQP